MRTLDTCLKQVKKLRHLNAFINPHLTRDDVITQPNTSGAPRPLEGVVFSVKNNFAVKGHPLTCGSAFLANFRPIYTATIVERFLSAGGILIGHCNMDEFATGFSTLTSNFGPTFSPWGEEPGETDLSKRYPRTCGGSSGGSAVSVLTGQCEVSLGSDTGGSVRLPAAFCGIVGFKPSYGALSRFGLVPLTSSTDCPGIFGRDVRTVAKIFDVLSGPDALDSNSVHIPKPKPSNHALRIGMINGNESGVKECMRKRLDEALEDLKTSYDVIIEELELPYLNYSIMAYNTITSVEAHSNMSKYIGILYGNGTKEEFGSDSTAEQPFCEMRNSLLGPLIRHRITYGTFLASKEGSHYYEQACKLRRAIINDFKLLKTADNTGDYDVIITPSTTGVAPECDVIRAMGPVASNERDPFSTAVNLAGLPAASVPIGLSADGLPLGLQVMAGRGCDWEVLKVAEMVEKSSRHSAIMKDHIKRFCSLD